MKSKRQRRKSMAKRGSAESAAAKWQHKLKTGNARQSGSGSYRESS